GEEDALAPDDRCRVPRFGECDLPAHVLRCAPGGRQAAFRGDAIAARTAPGGPVVGKDESAEKSDADQGSKQSKHNAASPLDQTGVSSSTANDHYEKMRSD